MTTPPTAGSLDTMSRTLTAASAGASPLTSIGFIADATVGSACSTAFIVSDDSSAMLMWGWELHASAAMTPSPPALVIMATPSLSILPHRENTESASNISSMSYTRVMFSFLKSTSNTESAPARAPVWDEAALDPAPVLPDFRITRGLESSMAFTALMNPGPSDMLSAYMPMTLVSSSVLR